MPKATLWTRKGHKDQFAIYTDADWGTNKFNRKSISGGVGMFYGGLFYWRS